MCVKITLSEGTLKEFKKVTSKEKDVVVILELGGSEEKRGKKGAKWSSGGKKKGRRYFSLTVGRRKKNPEERIGRKGGGGRSRPPLPVASGVPFWARYHKKIYDRMKKGTHGGGEGGLQFLSEKH